MTDTGKVLAIDTKDKWEKTLEECKSKDKLIIAHFTAPFIQSSRLMNPAFTTMSKKYDNAVFVKINGTKLPAVMAQYDVTGFPYFILIWHCDAIDSMGGVDEQKLEAKIVEALKYPLRKKLTCSHV